MNLIYKLNLKYDTAKQSLRMNTSGTVVAVEGRLVCKKLEEEYTESSVRNKERWRCNSFLAWVFPMS